MLNSLNYNPSNQVKQQTSANFKGVRLEKSAINNPIFIIDKSFSGVQNFITKKAFPSEAADALTGFMTKYIYGLDTYGNAYKHIKLFKQIVLDGFKENPEHLDCKKFLDILSAPKIKSMPSRKWYDDDHLIFESHLFAAPKD